MLTQGTGSRGRERAKVALHRLFVAGQRFKVDVLPRHFYSAVPDIRELAARQEWRAPSQMPGVRGADVDAQLSELRAWFGAAVVDALTGTDVYEAAVRANEAIGFGPAEAQMLHAFVATRRPRRVVQVGAGVSTAVILDAARTHGLDVRITCVDPYPTPFLSAAAERGDIALIREPAQVVPLEVFTDLGEGDLLFVDSTHTVKPGSEVNRLILEVLPRLSKGVVVHFHDITFPYDYQRDILQGALFFWNESTLLHAFLVDNSRVRILVSGSMLQYARESALRELLPRFDPRAHDLGLNVDGDLRDFAGSTYLLVDGD